MRIHARLQGARLGRSRCPGLLVTVTDLLNDSQNQRRAQTLQHRGHADLLEPAQYRGRMRSEEEQATPQQRPKPVSGCCASLGHHRHSHPPAKPPHNMEVVMAPNGRPWCATANEVTNTPTASPTQGPATRPAAHTATIRSLSKPACETVASSTRPRIVKTSRTAP